MSDILEEELTSEEAEALYNEFAAMPEDTVACGTAHGPCSEPVAWLALRHCCNNRKLLCDTHKRRVERVDNEKLQSSILPALSCFECRVYPGIKQYIPI